jgi:hypothetical protein
MKKIICILIQILFCSILHAQTTEQIKFINHTLDNTPYFDIRGFDYNVDYTLPDSTKTQVIKALNRELPQHFADSIFTLENVVLNNIRKNALQKCKTDTVCYKEEYQRMCDEEVEFRKKNYNNECISSNLILACGSWHIKEAVPYLEKELSNKNCNYEKKKKMIEMALAKLGNDSIMKQIKESGTIAYLSIHAKFDTTNNENIYYSPENDIIYLSTFNYSQLANYFKDKSFFYDMLDLLYVQGYVPAMDLEFEHTEITLLWSFDMYQQWRNYTNYNQWNSLVGKYMNIYQNAKKSKKEWEEVTSHSFKKQMISELKDWIEKNVNFE